MEALRRADHLKQQGRQAMSLEHIPDEPAQRGERWQEDGNPENNLADNQKGEEGQTPLTPLRSESRLAYSAVKLIPHEEKTSDDPNPDPVSGGVFIPQQTPFPPLSWQASTHPMRPLVRTLPVRRSFKTVHHILFKRRQRRLALFRRANFQQKVTLVTTTVLSLLLVAVLSSGLFLLSSFYQMNEHALAALNDPALYPLTTRIYDRNGKLLYEYLGNSDGIHVYARLSQIAPMLQDATVATEDRTFWSNTGVNLYSVLRAAFADVQGSSQGGSTITEQLIKNAFFIDPKTGVADYSIQRKIQEALLAAAVTDRYSKAQILEYYLNIIFYGDYSRGIEAAAENFFSLLPYQDAATGHLVMGAQQLDLAQAALLAGLPQSPTTNAPCGPGWQSQRPRALQRMHDVVLHSLLTSGYITEQQFLQADAEAHLSTFFKCRDLGSKEAPAFVDYVLEQLAMELTDDGTLGRGLDILAHAGLNVYTSLDLRVEEEVEQTVHHYLFEPFTVHYDQLPVNNAALSLPESEGGHNLHDAAVVVMDPRTGDILAMDGSSDYGNQDSRVAGNVNAAVSLIQPGSTFKPIVYATDFAMGWFPALVLQDVQTCFPAYDPADETPGSPCGPWYSPNNLDRTFGHHSQGITGVRIRDALGNSLNVPAVQALYFGGLKNVMAMAHRLGVGSLNAAGDCAGAALALGACTVTLLDMVDAYGVFATGGFQNQPRAILLVTDTQGHPLAGGDTRVAHPVQILDPQTAFLLTSMLSDNQSRVAEFGVKNPLTFGDALWAAAKTGTTDNFKDTLTVGYTPSLAVGVWGGNANGEPLTQNSLAITGAALIWHDVTLKTTQLLGYPNSYWSLPQGVGRFRVNADTGLAPYQGQQGNYTDWFVNGEIPDLS
jgi:membrane peptidoglycan carboxypeptidase